MPNAVAEISLQALPTGGLQPRDALVLIGLPASGKSTLASQLGSALPAVVIVSSDAIRAELYGDAAIQREPARVFAVAHARLHQALVAGNATIFDATNLEAPFRRRLLAQLRLWGAQRMIGLWLDTPLGVCRVRNQNRVRVIPDRVLERMHRQLCAYPPTLEEGFDYLVRLAHA
ncbi:MAG: AAA family ATPase [Gemmatimonadaceae bacterium]|nr:AAA family ATPase [Gloeobacterales cyanobacterium ES-bin-141]